MKMTEGVEGLHPPTPNKIMPSRNEMTRRPMLKLSGSVGMCSYEPWRLNALNELQNTHAGILFIDVDTELNIARATGT